MAPPTRAADPPPGAVLTVDVEDWFHILDSPAVPEMAEWDGLESRIARNVERILELLEARSVRATFFWLGWAAERHPELVRGCLEGGHEVASHGYGHVLAYQVGPEAFREDAIRGKRVLEDLTGGEIQGFRAAGFSARDDTAWVFEEIRRAGYRYDSSVFPAARGHGGMVRSRLEPYVLETPAGLLVEVPQSVVTVFGKRLSLFGGGYLRLAPRGLIDWGIRRLEAAGRPLLVYIHPREIDPEHPRLPLSPIRRLKSYVNLESTYPKLEWLCERGGFWPMCELAEDVLRAGAKRAVK